MSERLKDFEEAIDQMIHNYQSMVDSENRSKTELYVKKYVDYREFIVEAYKKALSRVEELEKENKRLEDFIETIQNVHFVELQREKAENRRYRETLELLVKQ